MRDIFFHQHHLFVSIKYHVHSYQRYHHLYWQNVQPHEHLSIRFQGPWEQRTFSHDAARCLTRFGKMYGTFCRHEGNRDIFAYASNQAAISEPELKDLRIMVPNFSTLKDWGSHDPESKYPPWNEQQTHLPGSYPKRKLIFQPCIFRCELLVSGRVHTMNRPTSPTKLLNTAW